jgi:hypothetical protein
MTYARVLIIGGTSSLSAQNEYWEIITDRLSASGWSWGCSSQIDATDRVLFTADAHRDNRKRFIVTADERLTAFLELERVTRETFRFLNAE